MNKDKMEYEKNHSCQVKRVRYFTFLKEVELPNQRKKEKRSRNSEIG